MDPRPCLVLQMRGQLAELWKHQSRSANEAKFTAADLDRKLMSKERELVKMRERCEKIRSTHRIAQAQLQQVGANNQKW
jgi:hypothetical protein